VQCNALTALARRRISWLIVALASVVTTPALADPRTEKDVQSLQKKAIEEDNLNVNYAGAIKKLQSAVTKCGADKCNAALKASLFRDLGAMQILNGATDEGKASFGQALSFDASIELDPSYKTPQLETIWVDVKKKGGGPAAPVKVGPQPSGDFTHTPPEEAQVRTPMPVYVEYSGSEDLARVTVKYKGAGMNEWKSLDLPKVDTGFGALIPCKDVTQGLIQYYVQGFSDKSDPVATSGNKKQPFGVAVNAQLTGPAPSLPGQDPPAQCEDVAGGGTECPPDFPGCAKKKAGGEDCEKDADCDSGSCSDNKCGEKKSNGDDCDKDADCSSGTCSSGKCSSGSGKKAEGDECEADEECDSGRCKEEKCASGSSGKGKRSKWWIGVNVQFDIDFLPGANDVCSLTQGDVNSAGYSCVQPGTTTTFPDNNPGDLTYYKNVVPGKGDQVIGGTKLGNIRLLASIDYAVKQNSLVGIRAGYVLGTDPAKPAFAPIHLEARYTYLFGRDALTKTGIAPMLFGGIGAGEFDAFVPVQVSLKGAAKPGTVNAWLAGGPVFLAAGFGGRALVTQKIALTAALKFQGAIGGPASFMPGIAPEVGIQFGF
jgi:hypothetical protein